ncbi:MAG: DNA-binding protein [Nocardioidaceae bacterium]|nr:DNA-binding protein [Nocardioidaceae bacterium]
MRPNDESTRAEIARQRLADIVAAFESGEIRPPRAPRVAPTEAIPRRPPPAPAPPPALAPAAPLAPAPVTPATARTRPIIEPIGLVIEFARMHARVVLVVVVAAASLTALWWMSARPQEIVSSTSATLTSESKAETPSGVMSPQESAGPTGEVVVDVAGKVVRPGIVTLPAGSRVIDALKAAGGAKPKADTTSLNLARVLADGEQIVVGLPAVAGAATDGSVAAPGAKVSLNSATSEQLDQLPGIGPVTAAAILKWRSEDGPFRTVEDLLDVKGIGDATLAELRDLVTP